jgi:tellurite resistance protein
MSTTLSTHDPARPSRNLGSTERLLERDDLERVSWGAIFLGLAIALGLQVLLGLLGVAIGLGVLDPSDPSGAGAWGVGTTIYVIIVQIVSLLTGGYIAARLSPAFTNRSAIVHGASIWALSTVIMVWLGTTAAGMVLTGMSNAVASMGNAAGQTVQALVPDELDLDLPHVAFTSLPADMQQTLRQRGITPGNLDQEIVRAYRQVVSPQEQQAVMEALRQAAADIARSPGDAATDIDQAVDQIFGQGGVLTREDTQQFQQTLQNRLGLSDDEVQQITAQVQQAIEDARQGARNALENAQRQTVAVAEGVSDQVASIAFWTFIASLLGLTAAVVGGWIGKVKLHA